MLFHLKSVGGAEQVGDSVIAKNVVWLLRTMNWVFEGVGELLGVGSG